MSKALYGFGSQDITWANVGTGKIKKYVNGILNDLNEVYIKGIPSYSNTI